MGTTAPRPQRLTDAQAPGLLVAREDELAAISGLLAAESGALRALVLEGAPGIGKTSLWERGIALGHEHGLRVLSARASGAETGLPFAAVIDLLDGVTSEELAELPSPQLHALNVALYREDPGETPPEPHAIALGLVSALRALATDRPLMVAVDDAFAAAEARLTNRCHYAQSLRPAA